MDWLSGGSSGKRRRSKDDTSDSSSDSDSDSEEKARKKRKEKKEKKRAKKEEKQLARMKKMYSVMNECANGGNGAQTSSSSHPHNNKNILTAGDLQVIRLLLTKYAQAIGDASTWDGIQATLEGLDKTTLFDIWKLLDAKAGAKAKKRSSQTAKSDISESITQILKDKVSETRA